MIRYSWYKNKMTLTFTIQFSISWKKNKIIRSKKLNKVLKMCRQADENQMLRFVYEKNCQTFSYFNLGLILNFERACFERSV